MRALFPSDARATIGWLHAAVGTEPLASIASWFTGDERLAVRLAELNGLTGPSVTRGTLVKVPVEYLLAPFRDAEPIPDEEPPRLEYGSDAKGRYAVYRLKRKEALYSAVVVRFTGRLHAEDVIQLALDIALRSGIDDVHGIPVGFPVKIPLELLSEEYLPPDDPKTAAREKERAEAALFATPAKARGLAGVRVVIDAGHGGRDTGTLHHGVWESTYVYDVASRLRNVLLETTRAEVVMMTREPGIGWEIPDRDRLPDRKARVLLTDPPYTLTDPTAGVNLRWYLANAILRRPGPGGSRSRRRGPSSSPSTPTRSIPRSGAPWRTSRASASSARATAAPRRSTGRSAKCATSRSSRSRRRSASWRKGASTSLAEKLIGAFRRRSLPVHQFRPVRTHVIRSGREWVPAVLRYNKIPNRVLFELSNLSNDEDRELTLTRAFRQQSAEALAEGLLAFFGGTGAPEGDAAVPAPGATPAPPDSERTTVRSIAAGPDADSSAREIAGPWPEIAGPWPSQIRARSRRGEGLLPDAETGIEGDPEADAKPKRTSRRRG